jgi:hypothetical protein
VDIFDCQDIVDWGGVDCQDIVDKNRW